MLKIGYHKIYLSSWKENNFAVMYKIHNQIASQPILQNLLKKLVQVKWLGIFHKFQQV
jgi:hypothetical protein